MKIQFRTVFLLLVAFAARNAVAQVPVMSSYPSATAVIFLDFDGQTVENTSWNYNGPIVCGPSGLTSTQITSVFNRVAEDYRPFNINITTDSTKYLAAPSNRRMRVIVTVTSDWYGSAGGVSFVGSFTWGDNTPAFVFSALLNYNEKNVGEAASHEAGHTLGLYHQSLYDANCIKLSDYNTGTGSGEIGWAPIMGVGYYRNFTLWNNGPNSNGCSSIQSDLNVITQGNGFNFRSDDFPGTFNQASTRTFTNNTFNVNGVIEQNTDADMFKFTLSQQQRLTVSGTPYNVGTGNVGSNLDMQVTLYNNSQTQLNVYNPGTLLNAIIDTVLNAGTYYLKVEGKGNIYAPNYASLGSYALQASLASATLPLRRLELQGNLVSDRHRLSWIIDADEQVVEQVLEMSSDGRNFQAIGQPQPADRSFVNSPNTGSAVQYRLKVSFDDGKTYYSNTITLRNVNNDIRPKLVSNLVSSSLLVSSPASFNYAIFDLNGRMVKSGNLTRGMNTISSDMVRGSMYVIRFTDNQNQWTEKFMKD